MIWPGLAVAALSTSSSIHACCTGCSFPALPTPALDRRRPACPRPRHRQDARADALAVDVNGARAAQRHAAAELRARHAEVLAQDPEQRRLGIDVEGVDLPVDIQADHFRLRFGGNILRGSCGGRSDAFQRSSSAPRISSSMRSFGRPAARFRRMRSSREATGTSMESSFHPLCAGDEILEAAGPRGIAEAVEVPRVGHEREVIAAGEGLGIGLKGKPLRSAAQGRFELFQRGGQGLQVLAISRVADVQIVRDGVRAPEAAREASDDDEAHSMVDEHLESADRIERAQRHRPIRSRLRASSTASRARSEGVSRSNSRIAVRSTPVPSFGASSIENPQVSRRRSSVSKRGETWSSSMREIVAW